MRLLVKRICLSICFFHSLVASVGVGHAQWRDVDVSDPSSPWKMWGNKQGSFYAFGKLPREQVKGIVESMKLDPDDKIQIILSNEVCNAFLAQLPNWSERTLLNFLSTFGLCDSAEDTLLTVIDAIHDLSSKKCDSMTGLQAKVDGALDYWLCTYEKQEIAPSCQDIREFCQFKMQPQVGITMNDVGDDYGYIRFEIPGCSCEIFPILPPRFPQKMRSPMTSESD